MSRDARFYFSNLGADVARCIRAAEVGDLKRYEDSRDRAYQTLSYLRDVHRPEAYEEGLLLLRGLEYARLQKTLAPFNILVNRLIAEYAPLG